MVFRSIKGIHQGLMLLLVALVGAGCPSISPHDNFRQFLDHSIGKSLYNARGWPDKEYLIDTTPLPNGHVEYRYQDIRTCQYIFEVDPATHLIVGARFEGKDTDCVINP